ncbi:hypothetical protein FISHEDRAFT_68951 [Fistulina hepatica ATCC 64428]|uniref:Yeast cell wall synthesis Kre9/Knh1-like N-terminal domain-containing protein n=1 Tax=Fistulina hepatica ATCC 64428 TaxID=1128425 RepID=A0A0D7AN99_9AGAR|nr:hypothetical protein FISHEDRAFT_68951 [Fistulina hepatica ATCC 64428]
MRVAAIAAIAFLPALALAEITISTPSASSYWVQNLSNVISWSYSSGDPNPISIVIVAKNSTTLNGDYSIAEYVEVSEESYTVTNVTLNVGSDYQVEFVNPSNESDVYATSGYFDVKAAGTTPADTSSATASTTASTATATEANTASGSASSSGSSTAASASSTSSKNGGTRITGTAALLSVFAAAVLGTVML